MKVSTSSTKLVLSGIMPFVFITLMMAYIFGPGAALLDVGVALPEIIIEQVDFVENEIQATIRNVGHIPVEIAVADVNDRIQPAAVEPDAYLQRYETALVRIPFDWNEAQPYVIGITVDDGTRFEKTIDAAAYALKPTLDHVGFFAIIGTFVGIIPVMIGLLWLPFIKKIKQSCYHFFLALTVGLLLFLGIDAIDEALDISRETFATSFNSVLLISTIIVVVFAGLYYCGLRLVQGTTSFISKPLAVALMISVGIGLHNFGEGLAIGAAIGLGSIAFSTFLIVGFALHNTTEGIAIASAAARSKVTILQLAALGMVAGTPAIFGAWIGGFVYSPLTAIIFLSVGAGAIFQIIIVILKWLYDEGQKNFVSAPIVSGLAIGMIVMYFTSILV